MGSQDGKLYALKSPQNLLADRVKKLEEEHSSPSALETDGAWLIIDDVKVPVRQEE